MENDEQEKEPLKPEQTNEDYGKLCRLTEEQCKELLEQLEPISESTAKLREAANNLLEKINPMSKPIEGLKTNILESEISIIKTFQDSIDRSLVPIHKFIEDFSKQTEEFSNLLKNTGFKFAEYFREIRNTYKEAFDIAESKGYLISLEQLTEVAVTIIENKEKNTGEVLTIIYDEKMLVSILDWANENPYFEKRKRIFEESIKAYLNGEYYLTIYALLPQIEGLIWDFLIAHSEKEELEKIKRSPKRKKDSLEQDYLDSISDGFVKELLKKGFDNDSILSNIFSIKNFLECTGEEFNRHAILHGVSTQFESKENALRIILLFDFMLSAIKSLEKS